MKKRWKIIINAVTMKGTNSYGAEIDGVRFFHL